MSTVTCCRQNRYSSTKESYLYVGFAIKKSLNSKPIYKNTFITMKITRTSTAHMINTETKI